MVRADRIELHQAEDHDYLSLFVAAHVLQFDQTRQSLLERSLSFRTAGFAKNWAEVLRGRPERFPRLDGHTEDRFLVFSKQQAEAQLGSIAVREAYAYDTYYKANLDVSGVAIEIGWQSDALSIFEEFVYSFRRSFLGGWKADCLIRLPVKRAFSFPDPRGLDNPYDCYREHSVHLDEIAQFRVDWAEVGASDFDKWIAWDSTPLTDVLTASTIVRIAQ